MSSKMIKVVVLFMVLFAVVACQKGNGKAVRATRAKPQAEQKQVPEAASDKKPASADAEGEYNGITHFKEK